MAQTAAAHHEAHHETVEGTSTGLSNRKLLMWVFLGSDVMFFGAFIATFLVYRNRSQVGPYPEDVLNIPITSISTFVLLMSSLLMVLALNAVQRDLKVLGRYWILGTAALGSVFLGFQVFEFYEFAHEGLTPRTNLFGSTFFILTGLHGAHVTLGVIWLLMMALVVSPTGAERRSLFIAVAGFYALLVAVLATPLGVIGPLEGAPAIVIGAIGVVALLYGGWSLKNAGDEVHVSRNSLDLEIAGLYWHFVDIVWIVIFTVVYLISARDGAPPGATPFTPPH